MFKEKKKKSQIDKVLMGAVIGGAIGSVLGISLAPKKGEDTRKEIKDAATNVGQKTSKFFGSLKKIFRKKKKEISHEIKEPKDIQE